MQLKNSLIFQYQLGQKKMVVAFFMVMAALAVLLPALGGGEVYVVGAPLQSKWDFDAYQISKQRKLKEFQKKKLNVITSYLIKQNLCELSSTFNRQNIHANLMELVGEEQWKKHGFGVTENKSIWMNMVVSK